MIKLRYVAQVEIEDDVSGEGVLPIEEIRENIRKGEIERGLKIMIAEGFMNPKITITRTLADIIEVKEGEEE